MTVLALEARRALLQKCGNRLSMVFGLMGNPLEGRSHLKQGVQLRVHGFAQQSFGQAHGMGWIDRYSTGQFVCRWQQPVRRHGQLSR